ncbi:MAG: hypothetical protein AAB426_13995, partial [Myxococcota bacterium]
NTSWRFDTPRSVTIVRQDGSRIIFDSRTPVRTPVYVVVLDAEPQVFLRGSDEVVAVSGLHILGVRVAALGVDAGGDTRLTDEYARTVEAEFQEMKLLAEKAGWPRDLAPKIVDIDKQWQAAKATANARRVSVVREVGPDSELRIAIRKMIEMLKAGLARGAEEAREKGVAPGVPGAPPYVPDDAWPTWKKAALAALVCGTAVGGAFLLRRVG